MSRAACAALLHVLREPGRLAELDESRWDLVLRQAASAGLAATIAARADACGLLEAVPAPVRRHLRGWLRLAERKRQAVHFELVQLGRDLAELPGPVLLLKGAAYAALDLPPAQGRLFGDIDLMVPAAQLPAAEAALMLVGWANDPLSDYDQRYYRRWMHELPPLRHLHRGTVLDLHHDILPPTARIRTHPERILAAARPVPAHPALATPCIDDLILHSATHWFHEGEWQQGLRGLVDLDALVRHAMTDAAAWARLRSRAGELGLGRPLVYALRACRRWLATPVPDGVLDACPGAPGRLARSLLEPTLDAGMGALHPSCRGPATGAAGFALYVRSHWLRMPLRLLLPHLVYKAWQDNLKPLFDRETPAQEKLP